MPVSTECAAALLSFRYPNSNCSKIGMMKSNITNKKPQGGLHPSIKKWIQLTF